MWETHTKLIVDLAILAFLASIPIGALIWWRLKAPERHRREEAEAAFQIRLRERNRIVQACIAAENNGNQELFEKWLGCLLEHLKQEMPNATRKTALDEVDTGRVAALMGKI